MSALQLRPHRAMLLRLGRIPEVLASIATALCGVVSRHFAMCALHCRAPEITWKACRALEKWCRRLD